MLDSKLDYFFPFFVFFYGAILVFVHEVLLPLCAEKPIFQRHNTVSTASRLSLNAIATHKPLAWTCFWLGGLWSLQNLLF